MKPMFVTMHLVVSCRSADLSSIEPKSYRSSTASFISNHIRVASAIHDGAVDQISHTQKSDGQNA